MIKNFYNEKSINKTINEIMEKLNSTNILKNTNRSKAFKEKLLDNYSNFQNLKLYLYLTGLNEAGDYIYKESNHDFKYAKSNNALNKTLKEYFDYLNEEFTNGKLSFTINMNNYSDYLDGQIHSNLKTIIEFILTQNAFKDYFIHTINISNKFNDHDKNKIMDYYDYDSFIEGQHKILASKNYLKDCNSTKEYFNSLISFKETSFEYNFSKVNLIGRVENKNYKFTNSLDYFFVPSHLLICLKESNSKNFIERIAFTHDLSNYNMRDRRIMDVKKEGDYLYLLDYVAYHCLKFGVNFQHVYSDLISPIIKDVIETSRTTKKFCNFITDVFENYDNSMPIDWQWALKTR